MRHRRCAVDMEVYPGTRSPSEHRVSDPLIARERGARNGAGTAGLRRRRREVLPPVRRLHASPIHRPSRERPQQFSAGSRRARYARPPAIRFGNRRLALREGLRSDDRFGRRRRFARGHGGISAHLSERTSTSWLMLPRIRSGSRLPFWPLRLAPSAALTRRAIGIIATAIIAIVFRCLSGWRAQSITRIWKTCRRGSPCGSVRATATVSVVRRACDFLRSSAATAVVIPLRAGTAASSPVEVRFRSTGEESQRLVLHPEATGPASNCCCPNILPAGSSEWRLTSRSAELRAWPMRRRRTQLAC